MKIGRLRHKVVVEHFIDSRDSFGAPVKEWQELKALFASIEPIKGQEYFDSKKINAKVDVKITTRYFSGYSPKTRIRHGSIIYEIESIINVDEKNIVLIFMCTQVV